MSEEKKDLSDIEMLEAIRDICRDSEDGLAAWRAYRVKFGENRIDGRNSSEREQHFLGMYQAYTKYPAQFTMDLRQAKIRAFMRKLAEAFLSSDVSETEVEHWFSCLEEAKHGSSGVLRALDRLRLKKPKEAALLAFDAEILWPTVLPEAPPSDGPDDFPKAVEEEVRDDA